MNEIKIELENEDLIRYDAELVLQSLKNFIERIDNAVEKEKKTLLQLLIKKIIYGMKIIRIELFYLPAIDNCTKERTEMLPLLDELRNFCYTNKIKIPSLLAA